MTKPTVCVQLLLCQPVGVKWRYFLFFIFFIGYCR